MPPVQSRFQKKKGLGPSQNFVKKFEERKKRGPTIEIPSNQYDEDDNAEFFESTISRRMANKNMPRRI
jgi:hypothetical protein